MPRRCSVPGCKSNYKDKVTTFCFPISQPLRSQWIKAINRKNFIPTINSAVCIEHFDQEFVKLYDSFMMGESVLKIKRGRPELSKDAYPTIFNNTPKHLNTNHPNQISMLPFDHHLPEKSTQNTQTLDHVSNGTTATIDEVYIKEEILEVPTQSTQTPDHVSDGSTLAIDEVYIKEGITKVPIQSTQTPDHVSDETTEIDIKEEKFEVEIQEIDGTSHYCSKEDTSWIKEEEMDQDPLEDSDKPQCSKNAEVIQKAIKEEHDPLSEDLPQRRETFDEFQGNQQRLESQEPDSQFSESSDIIRSKNQCLDSEQPQPHCSKNSGKKKMRTLFYLVLIPRTKKELICPTCEKKFKTKCSFDQHLKDCKGSKKRRKRGKIEKLCTTCGHIFNSNSFYSHQRCHSEEKPYSCETCERSFKRKADLEDHRAVHSEEKPFLCSICALPFKRKRNLRKHELTHSKMGKIRQSQPYLCSTCGMIFKLKSSLENHLVSHSEERPHLCETCGFAFKREKDLRHHLPIHSEERPFSCDICGSSFKRKKYLLVHNKTHKDKEKHTKPRANTKNLKPTKKEKLK